MKHENISVNGKLNKKSDSENMWTIRTVKWHLKSYITQFWSIPIATARESADDCKEAATKESTAGPIERRTEKAP